MATDVLPESVVEPAPESFVLFLFNNGKDISFCGFVRSVLHCFETIRQVLPPVALPMLLKVIALLLADHHAKFDVIVIGHGIGGKDIPIMARLAKVRHWSKR